MNSALLEVSLYLVLLTAIILPHNQAHAGGNCASALMRRLVQLAPTALSSAETGEIIKQYIAQGPIVNFYLRSRSDPAQSAVSTALFKANNLDIETVNKFIKDLDRVLRENSGRQTPPIVFRGETRPKGTALVKGTQLHYENYISTIRDRNLALGYARQPSEDTLSVLYEIEVSAGQPGVQINELAPVGARNQDEFLLIRNSSIVVESTSSDGNLVIVKARYQPD